MMHLKYNKDLKNDIDIFKEFTKTEESVKNKKKVITPRNAIILLNGKQKVIDSFEPQYF